MRLDDIYPSIYMRADDLKGEDVVFTIREVDRREFDDGTKPVCWFEESSKGLILNRTNFKSIVKLHGAESDDWQGKLITLFGTEVAFRGTPTLAIRVRLTVPEAVEVSEGPIPF